MKSRVFYWREIAQSVRHMADTGEGIRPKKGGGVGLANIRERLKALYGGAAKLVIEENAPHGLVASIELPAVALP